MGAGEDRAVDIDLTADESAPGVEVDAGSDARATTAVGIDSGDGTVSDSGLISLDSLLADPTPEPESGPHSPTAGDDQVDRTYVLQSVGVGEVPGVEPDLSPRESQAVSFTGTSGGLLLQIPVDAIRPNEFQPRRRFDEPALVALTDSIRELGVLQPILVRRLTTPQPGPDSTIEFELVAGERRWRGARRAGLSKVPAILRDVSDLRSLEEAIVENLHRSDLNPIEEAAAYQQLIDDFGLSQAQIAQRVGKSRSAVANTLRLVQLPAAVQRLVIAGELSAGHARTVLSVPSFDQVDFAIRLVSEQLSVRQAEEMAQNWSESRLMGPIEGASASGPSTPEDGDRLFGQRADGRSVGALEVERQLGDRLDTRVRVDESARGGRIVVEFANSGDLARIFQLLQGNPTDLE